MISESICSLSVKPLCLNADGNAWDENGAIIKTAPETAMNLTSTRKQSPPKYNKIWETVEPHYHFFCSRLALSNYCVCFIRAGLDTTAANTRNPGHNASTWSRGYGIFIRWGTGTEGYIRTCVSVRTMDGTCIWSWSLGSNTLRRKDYFLQIVLFYGTSWE